MKTLQPRSLTFGELKALRKAGFDPAFSVSDNKSEQNSNMITWILENVFKEEVTDDMPYADLLKLAVDSYGLTYGRELEIKN